MKQRYSLELTFVIAREETTSTKPQTETSSRLWRERCMAISHQENGTQNICQESCHTENCKQSIRRKLKELQKPAYAEKHGQKPPSSLKHLNGTSTPYNTGTNNRTILAMSQEYEGGILSSETSSAMWKHQIQCVPFWVHAHVKFLVWVAALFYILGEDSGWFLLLLCWRSSKSFFICLPCCAG